MTLSRMQAADTPLALAISSHGFEAQAGRRLPLGGDHPKLVLHFDCVARGKMMFRDQEKLANLRRLRQSLGPDGPWAGFYSYGEIGPVSNHNCFHTFSAVVLALG
jgi:small ligand-binding sensory domain FIST